MKAAVPVAKTNRKRRAVNAALALLAAACLVPLSLAGCFGGGRAPAVELFVLDYTPPSFEGLSPIDAVLRVNSFSVSQAFDTTAMVYKKGKYGTQQYNYSRWRSNPADIVADHLLADLTGAGIFEAVLPYSSTHRARFQLDGRVEKFYELNEGTGRAVLGVSVTLLDNEGGTPGTVLLQKSYEAMEPMAEDTANGLAAAMSRAMKSVSERIITDVHEAASRAL